jgi:hypothetical protein
MRWFARLFGGRDDENRYEESTAAPVQRPATPPVLINRPAAAVQQPTAGKPRKDFDPYNSGSFKRRNAWERVGRR